MNVNYTYTTADELAFMRLMFMQGKTTVLRTLLRHASHRVWFGRDMSVDAGLVIQEGRELLGRLDAIEHSLADPQRIAAA